MTAEQLRQVLEANLAAGDVGEEEKERILALIAAAERQGGAPAQRKVPTAA